MDGNTITLTDQQREALEKAVEPLLEWLCGLAAREGVLPIFRAVAEYGSPFKIYTTLTDSPPQATKAELPDILNAKRHRLEDADGNAIYIIVCSDDSDAPAEVFTKFPFDNRAELREKTTMWATVCRLVSLALRCRVSVDEIVTQLNKASGHDRDLPEQLAKILGGGKSL